MDISLRGYIILKNRKEGKILLIFEPLFTETLQF